MNKLNKKLRDLRKEMGENGCTYKEALREAGY